MINNIRSTVLCRYIGIIGIFGKQYSKNGNVLKAYKFDYIYPVTLTDISMSWDSIGQIEEYSCTFDYQYFKTNYDYIDPDVDKNLDQNYYKTMSPN